MIGKKIKMTRLERLVFALFMIKIRRRYKHTRYVFNDLTSYNFGVQKLNWGNPIYKGENYFYLSQIPIYNIQRKKWVTRLMTGGVVEINHLHFADHTFTIGNTSGGSGLMSIQSRKDTQIVLWVSPTIIKNVIKE